MREGHFTQDPLDLADDRSISGFRRNAGIWVATEAIVIPLNNTTSI